MRRIAAVIGLWLMLIGSAWGDYTIGTFERRYNNVVYSVAFSPDGRYAISGGDDRALKLWDVASGQEIRAFKGHTGIVNSVAFSPDGRYLISGGNDETLKLWDIANAKGIMTFAGTYVYGVYSVAFSPDGHHVLSGGDNNLNIWKTTVAPTHISHTELLSAMAQNGLSLQKRYSDNKIYAYFANNRWYVGTKEQLLLRTSPVSSTSPFARIDELFQKQLAILIPSEVHIPTLPAMKELIKDEFETKTIFEARIAQAIKAREDEIAAIQTEYRQKVEERNAKIEIFRPEYEAFMKSDGLGARNTPLYKQIEDAMIASFQTVMGGIKLSNAAYDAENQTMYIDLNATNASYGKRITIHVPLVEAKAFKENLAQLNPTATFAFKSGALILKEIKVANKDKEYLAMLADKDFKPERVSVALKDKKVDFNLNLQNPNLIDRYQVQALGYSEAANLTRLGVKDDLTPLVAKMKATSKTPNKWLFAIAVENYAEADPVIFAKNSAEAFVAAAKKRFGIDDRHTYAYIDDKATGSGIKNNLERFLENIKDGDTIYFYYSGHGIPSPIDGEAFILPRDAIADYITKEQEFMARTIYKKLSESKAGKVFAFVDSCYSGKTDNIANIKGVAAGVFKTKKVEFDKNKMVVMTAGTSGQFSNAFNEKGHRLFTYHLTKAIIERPTLDMESLYQEVALKVKDESFKKGDIYRQEPQIEGNMKLELLK